jgi:hypothetical protein
MIAEASAAGGSEDLPVFKMMLRKGTIDAKVHNERTALRILNIKLETKALL